MEIRSHRDLDVWQAGIALAKGVYSASRSLPKEELFGLTNQMRRAVVSIPVNIAEGSGRQHTKEFIQFLYIARGSLRELETLLLIADDVFQMPAAQELLEQCDPVGRMLSGLINALERRPARKRLSSTQTTNH
jgi:four helix bundle protein